MTDAIAVVEKNSREEVRITLDEFSGHQLLDIRIFADYQAGGIDVRGPTKKGVSIKVEKLPDLIAALEAAREEAALRGLLPGG